MYSYLASYLSMNIRKYCTHSIDFVFIDGMKAEYHQYLQKIVPYLHTRYTVICDDVIKFKNKLQPLYRFLEQKQIQYTIHHLDDDDGILVIDSCA